MTKQEQVKAIFIEEAGEIIEKLDVDILRFEENSTDFDLLNEIFRGVHTLKGNANAFGFTRLGEFVHHFEDVLDYYRSTKEEIEIIHLELIVNSVDVIKEVMVCELDALPDLPEDYEQCLEGIKVLIASKKGGSVQSSAPAEPVSAFADLAAEFGLECPDQYENMITQSIEMMRLSQQEGMHIYRIELTLDPDSYKRGFDHQIFIGLLAEKAVLIESVFNFESVPVMENFSCEENYLPKMGIILLTTQSISEIEENFEFLFDHEYSIRVIENAAENSVPETVTAPIETVADTPKTASKTSSAGMDTSTLNAAAKSTIRIDTFKLDELFDSVGELVIAQNFIAQNEKIRLIEDESISRTIETLSKITKRIQDRVMSLRMVAIRDTFDKMKRVVRDTSKKTGKELHLNVLGEETEIDKTMIDSLSDPLIHIIRNAIDHGLEADGEERLKAGKKTEGNITLRAYHKSGSIVISVSDDGRGINKEKVLQKAIERGIITGDENLTDSQIFGLIMQPGFSTADAISDLSGRGVGLDVVKTSIEKLRGKIEIESQEGEGTTFSMVLPLTLAIIDGMLVEAAGEIYIIPTLSVVESFRPEQEIVHALKEKGEFVSLRGQHLPIIRLSDVFNLPTTERIEPWDGILVCVETEAGRIAIMVDELVGRQQVVIKPLGKSLAKLKEISGGAILGSGDIALILNVDALRPVIEGTHA
ncbi:CheA signal transduction histidine kinase [Sulfuricurvum kujiense DSM 16994]|uniref:Chemotaxis protein CheA n=1 Tax=Sulfuricurvum kujiense (strain ATCC BAA-921 / DSM 16994 / JCM 11577 / YK-1) TaxID=709032 RepID=E4U257_SULKY|nr:chemotaxis protein CheA [Sulfuricurvum kujiense]ADR34614.1 CheA signal transduction histidine kinase [Sulfuricurvum kujiense DSM 16994]